MVDLAKLKDPFKPSQISWRVGPTTKDKTKGQALCYIDARDVQDRLDEVCGVEGWQCRYVPMHDKKTVCEIGIRMRFCPEGIQPGYPGFSGEVVRSEWIWKSDGAGDSDIEAEKGALSDAFKRAAVRWGIGRYLYDLESPWVELDTYEKDGKVFAKGIKAHEYKRLEALLAGKQAPTQREAIHGASTLKPQGDKHPSAAIYAPTTAPPQPLPPQNNTLTPQAWAEMGLARVSGFKTMQELDAFEKRFEAKIVQIAPLVPDLHAKLVSAMADKRFVLEAKG